MVHLRGLECIQIPYNQSITHRHEQLSQTHGTKGGVECVPNAKVGSYDMHNAQNEQTLGIDSSGKKDQFTFSEHGPPNHGYDWQEVRSATAESPLLVR